MKFRSGFVSNSSSSSFLVPFVDKPKDAKELQSMLFSDRKYFNHPYNNVLYGTDFIAEHIFWEVSKKTNKKQIESFFKRLAYEDLEGKYPYDFGMSDKEWEIRHNKMEQEVVVLRDEKMKKFLKDYEKHHISFFEFSDNEGTLESALEHGDVFRGISGTIIINNH